MLKHPRVIKETKERKEAREETETKYARWCSLVFAGAGLVLLPFLASIQDSDSR